ncbi:LuxR C-terminal-related transcriptional regulator [Nocardia tengchongensis]|uniref:LuxR C-terminal-related transcriptional regulator n=1 Tax=Nocardia tengchongensis TaxID=2055889 RepID=UPI00368C9387
MLDSEINVVGDAECGAIGIELVAALRPQVVILDVEIPGETVTATLRQITQVAPASKVLIVTMHEDPSLVYRLLDYGAAGYLHKSASRDELLCAIRAVVRDDGNMVVMTRRPQQSVAAADVVAADGTGALTIREVEVIRCVAAAMSNRQIASTLGIAEGTVKRHMRNIFDKLGAESRLDAVNRAQEARIL